MAPLSFGSPFPNLPRAVAALIQRTLPWIAFFLIVLGARLCLIAPFGSSLPLMDQWDAEAATVFRPYLEGKLQLRDFFNPHTESRMLPSRALALGLLGMNGQWDGRLQMAVNAIIFALMATVFAAVAIRLAGRAQSTVVMCAVAGWAVLPFAWENTTWGFQSSFYFLVLFSLLAIWGIGMHRGFSISWWAGAVAALVAGLSMASGVVVFGALAGLEMLRLGTGRKAWRDTWPTIAFCGLATAWLTYIRPEVPTHSLFKAASLADWAQVTGRYLAWPYPTSAACLLVYLPLALLLIMYVNKRDERSDDSPDRSIEMLLAVGAWVALQAAGIAYARGGQSHDFVPSRYMDILAVGAIANLLALLLLIQQRHRHRKAIVLGGVLWSVALAAGAVLLSVKAVADARKKAHAVREAQNSVRAYVATKDRSLLPPGDRPGLPYPAPDWLGSLLDDPNLSRILPAAIRTPLKIESDGETTAFSVVERDPGGNEFTAARAWSSKDSGGGIMRSQVIRPSLPYLQVEVVGRLATRMSLTIRSDETGRGRRFVASDGNHREWRQAFAAVPPGAELRLIARDENVEAWFTFSEPVEVGQLSYWAELLLRRALYVVLAGGAIAAGLGLHRHFQRTAPAERL